MLLSFFVCLQKINQIEKSCKQQTKNNKQQAENNEQQARI